MDGERKPLITNIISDREEKVRGPKRKVSSLDRIKFGRRTRQQTVIYTNVEYIVQYRSDQVSVASYRATINGYNSLYIVSFNSSVLMIARKFAFVFLIFIRSFNFDV